jgi:hypothetical protein
MAFHTAECYAVIKRNEGARHQWLVPVILATQEAEIRRSQSGQSVQETLSWKIPSQKRAGDVVQRVVPEFKP